MKRSRIAAVGLFVGSIIAVLAVSRLAGCAMQQAPYRDMMVGMSKAPPASASLAPRSPQDDNFGGEHDRQPGFNTESYDHIVDNPFLTAVRNPLSTFAVDVDTASYSVVRRFLTGGQLPPPGAVRIEELVNYFTYDYPSPDAGTPFSASLEVAGCPWTLSNRLIRIALKGREIPQDKRPISNLVFLLDVSGSMADHNKLPLMKDAMKLLVNRLNENDRVAIVVYASECGVKLPSTTGDRREAIQAAIDQLQAGGSTNGAGGIQKAYEVAVANFIKGGVNRVILCTDGDFNVGITDQSQLVRMIEDKAKAGVSLTVLGVGMGNYKDSTLEKLADKGHGNYAYLDTPSEAKKVLVEQMSGTLVTIAKDAKVQVEFNPAKVASWRLIGYENRVMRAEDFNNDKKDGGDIGAGHTVTALYEIVPTGLPGSDSGPTTRPEVDPLKYQAPGQPTPAAGGDELLTVKLRYKAPDGDSSQLLSFPATDTGSQFAAASGDFRFAASVAAFGMLLRNSQFKGDASYGWVIETAGKAKGSDKSGYRTEFVELATKAKGVAKK